jgi:hypothetical protein
MEYDERHRWIRKLGTNQQGSVNGALRVALPV